MKLRSLAVLLLSGTAAAISAQTTKPDEDKKSAWDVSAPPGERREVPIDTRSGTWMSVDVSPDGKRIAFDMLGDIYELPIEGGEARALASGLAWDMQPRYSPDGKWIAFTSDRAGGDNLWIMDASGGGAKQITKETLPPAEQSRVASQRPLRCGPQALHDAALARHGRDLALQPRRRRGRDARQASERGVSEGARRAGVLARWEVRVLQPERHARAHLRVRAGHEQGRLRDQASRAGHG